MNARNPIAKITTGEICAYCGTLFVLGMMYYTALYVNRGGYSDPKVHYFSLKEILNWGGLDYFFKFLISLPVIWLMFYKLPHIPVYQRLLIHLITLPISVLIWQQLYYAATDAWGMFHLSGPASAWDLYIPAMFYIVNFSMLHAYMYFKQVQEQQKLEAELREVALKSELTALKAQLNPHFLYNVFNTINASLPPGQEKTRQMIAELADLFRYQLQASKTDMVPLREELDFVRKYLDLEKARFEERLQVIFKIGDGLLDHHVPPMLLQPLIENAIKHGIAPLIKGGTVTIEILKTDGKLHFTVSDNGNGLKENSRLVGTGTGITNTAMRLEKMFGSKLIFKNNEPQGLIVNFSI